MPEWLTTLAEKARNMEVDPYLRPPATGGRRAAILVLFGEGPLGPDLLLIQRSDAMRKHAGQPAFPGGGLDEDDDGPIAAALREAEEETGLEPAGVEIAAVMPELYLRHSDNRVTPVLAWWRDPSAVHAADPREVASVERVPVAELADPANRVMIRSPDGYKSPAFHVRGLLVWGFTAGVVDRLLSLGGWEKPWDRNRVEGLPAQVISLAARD
ncbi:NUDIX hydrolase [Bailinhaonella thermotolerans]|nr:CoA pyrophosphatase [Bailinhaonella thermotolerans]